jgi:KaiC/GvpD/RAD55 family RecA-like ATPase
MAERIKTAIPGFDDIVAGGFVKNSVNLLSGGAGTGKSIFCLQFLFNGATQFNEKGVYISSEESILDLKSDLAQFGMDFNQVADMVKFVFISPYEITNFAEKIKDTLKQHTPCRVVIDSVTSLVSTLEDEFERRKELFLIIRLMKDMDCTTLLVSENPGGGDEGQYSRYGVEEYMADSVILLNFESMGGNYSRTLSVRKMRKTKHNEDVHPLEISEKGIVVHHIQ